MKPEGAEREGRCDKETDKLLENQLREYVEIKPPSPSAPSSTSTTRGCSCSELGPAAPRPRFRGEAKIAMSSGAARLAARWA